MSHDPFEVWYEERQMLNGEPPFSCSHDAAQAAWNAAQEQPAAPASPFKSTDACAEVCERAKLCALCLRGIDEQPAAYRAPVKCMWAQDCDDDSRTYSTECGRYFNLEDGTPEDNKFKYCCFCGGSLEQHLFERDDDEGEA
jgi:hypothetical protein